MPMRCVVLCCVTDSEVITMTKGVTIHEIVKKLDNVLEVTANKYEGYPLTKVSFKKIMMLYPEDGPVMTSERSINQKYLDLKEFGILSSTGRIDLDQFTAIVKGEM